MWLLNAYFGWRVRRQTRKLSAGGRSRSYYVHVPPTYHPDTPTPVILALHGATMTGPMMAKFTQLNRKADQAGFIVVYPNGTGSRFSYFWNSGHCCGSAVQKNVDDVAFIRAVLDDLAFAYSVDRRRVFAVGMSNGAMMAYRLASELSDRIAAVTAVAGTMATEECRPQRPVPILHMHGTDDQFIPFTGGRGMKSITGLHHFSVEHSVRTWVRANGCNEKPAVEELPDVARDGTTVIRKTYTGGRDGSEVILVVIQQGGHSWPGRQVASKALGKATTNVSANDLLWEFFENHPMS